MENNRFDKRSTNICKGAAVIFLFFHHLFYKSSVFEGLEVCFPLFGQDRTGKIAFCLKTCVYIFVFLSGFGVYRSGLKKKGKSFSERYFYTVSNRLYSLFFSFITVYLLSQLFSPLLGLSRQEIYGGETGRRMLYTLVDSTGLADLFGTPTYNPTWWYIPLAYMLIILLPLLSEMLDRLGFAPFCLFMVILEAYLLKAKGIRLDVYLPSAALGLVCAKYDVFERLRAFAEKKKGRFAALSCLLLAAFAASSALYFFNRSYNYIIEAFAALSVCALCFILSGLSDPVSQWTSALLALIGDYSIYIFLIHTLLYRRGSTLRSLVYLPRYPLAIVALFILETIALSFFVHIIRQYLFGLIEGFRSHASKKLRAT